MSKQKEILSILKEYFPQSTINRISWEYFKVKKRYHGVFEIFTTVEQDYRDFLDISEVNEVFCVIDNFNNSRGYYLKVSVMFDV